MIPYQPMKFISQRFGQIGIILLGFLLFFGCASAPSHIAEARGDYVTRSLCSLKGRFVF